LFWVFFWVWSCAYTQTVLDSKPPVI
jgi:hypothetical protein